MSMKFFIYKALITFFLVFVLFKLTIGSLMKNYEKKVDQYLSKEHLTQIGAIQEGDSEAKADGEDATAKILTSYSTTGEEDDSAIEPVPPSAGRTFLPD